MKNSRGHIIFELLSAIPVVLLVTSSSFLLIGIFFSKLWVENALYSRIICEIKESLTCENQFQKSISHTPWVQMVDIKLKQNYDRQKYKTLTGHIHWNLKYYQALVLDSQMTLRERDLR